MPPSGHILPVFHLQETIALQGGICLFLVIIQSLSVDVNHLLTLGWIKKTWAWNQKMIGIIIQNWWLPTILKKKKNS